MQKEQKIINLFNHKLNGDDAAVIDINGLFSGDGDRFLLASKDLFMEGAHFKPGWLSPYQIGFKAMMVNLSDAIAMNASPKYALLGLAVPAKMSPKELKELSNGLKDAAKAHGCEIIGGDTVKGDKLFISITILATSALAVARSGAKAGDLVLFTGRLGESKRGLKTLINGGKIASNSRFVKPVLRARYMHKMARFMRSAMDISDGLASDLPKIASGFAIKWRRRLSPLQLSSGEEYELLFTIAPKHLNRARNEAKKCRVPLTILGKLKRGRVKTYGAFSHF